MTIEHRLERLPDSDLECLRCRTRMKSAGPVHLVGGTFAELYGLKDHTRLDMELEVCPKCGKSEFFL